MTDFRLFEAGDIRPDTDRAPIGCSPLAHLQPSAVGETLLKSADFDIYVRDRSPQVRFTGKNYVLPRVGQEGVPIISVNTPKVAVDILRVGDRNLIQTVRSVGYRFGQSRWAS